MRNLPVSSYLLARKLQEALLWRLYRPIHDEDVLGCSLSQLQAEVQCVVSSARADREEALREQGRLTQEMSSLKEQLQHTREALRESQAEVLHHGQTLISGDGFTSSGLCWAR